MGYLSSRSRGNVSQKITRVTIFGLVLACLAILEGIACLSVDAASQAVDSSDELQLMSESYADAAEQQVVAATVYEAVIESSSFRDRFTPASTPEVLPHSFATKTENTNTELSVVAESVQSSETFSQTSSQDISETIIEPQMPATSDTTNRHTTDASLNNGDDSNQNLALLPEEAIPQARTLAPMSVSPGTIADKIEPTEIRDTDIATVAANPEVIKNSFTEDSLQLDALPSTRTSTGESVIASKVSNTAFPEGAMPPTRVFSPSSSFQPTERKVSTQDNGATDSINDELPESTQVELTSMDAPLNRGVDIALEIAQVPGAVEPGLGPLIPNNGSNPFGIADENPVLPVSPSELPPPQNVLPVEPEPEPELEPFELPPADELLGPSETLNQPPLPTDDVTFKIEEFVFNGNTAFSNQELIDVTAEFRQGELQTFADVANAREAVTELYVNEGYATSGAIVPPQSVSDGVVEIEIIEGELDDIVVQGTQRLRSGYINSRIGLSAAPPLNVNRLVERLQLLQSDPLIESISADLQASPEPGKNTLVVSVAEADSFGVTYALDNNRSPSVGTVRHQLGVSEGNLLGFGDRLAVDYTLTSGSDGFGFDYTVPVSPYDTTLGVSVNLSDSEVIEDPFDVLEIESDSEAYEVTLRHPLKRSPTQELAIGLTASHQRTQTELGFDDLGPFPLSPGADDDGRTRVSALRFFQDWTHRSTKQVLALRSQFNVGIDVLGATVNDDEPDSQFFSWQGQAQWLKLLAADTPLIVKGSAQLATDSLLSLEQLRLGGQSTVRGYRQNFLSTDNGVSASAEVRLPIARERPTDMLLQLAPFVDAGYGWNNDGEDPDPIVGVGLGLVFSQSFRDEQEFSARLDWGVPLTDAGNNRNSLQESGVYFSMRYSFF